MGSVASISDGQPMIASTRCVELTEWSDESLDDDFTQRSTVDFLLRAVRVILGVLAQALCAAFEDDGRESLRDEQRRQPPEHQHTSARKHVPLTHTTAAEIMLTQ